jgi:hypothetical protein
MTLRRIPMNAAVVHAFDAPPRYTPFAEPAVQEGEVLVKVRERRQDDLAPGGHAAQFGAGVAWKRIR